MRAIIILLLLLRDTRSFRGSIPSSRLSPSRRPNYISKNPAMPRIKLKHYTNQALLSHIDATFFSNTIPPMLSEKPALFFAIYSLLANTIYLLRRSHIRNMPKRTLFQIRLTRENGVSLPLYITNLLVWQLFVNFIFPFLEPISRLLGHVSFYYFYPNANGLGIIFEPLSIQDQPMNKRTKQQIRLDWHEFNFNIGNIGRDGYRHPPCVSRNLPHLDVPKLGWKHWPWRRKYKQR